MGWVYHLSHEALVVAVLVEPGENVRREPLRISDNDAVAFLVRVSRYRIAAAQKDVFFGSAADGAEQAL